MRRTIVIVLLNLAWACAPLAQAGTKEELVRLQNDVLALQNQVREFDKNYSEKLEGLKSLVVQLNDQVAKSEISLGRIAAALESQSTGTRDADRTLLEEVRALSGKLDDASMRVSALAQQVAELKLQSKPIAAESAGLLPPDTLYDQASADLVRGNYDLAVQGFSSYLAGNPGGTKAPPAQYGIGEAYYYQGKMQQAAAAYTRILSDYPDSELRVSALFKRAKAEVVLKERENAIADFKEVVERYPGSSEASLARTELQALGVKPGAPSAKPAPRKPR